MSSEVMFKLWEWEKLSDMLTYWLTALRTIIRLPSQFSLITTLLSLQHRPRLSCKASLVLLHVLCRQRTKHSGRKKCSLCESVSPQNNHAVA